MKHSRLSVLFCCIGAQSAAVGQQAPADASPFEDPVQLNIPDPSPEEDRIGPQEEAEPDYGTLGYTVVTADGQVQRIEADPVRMKALEKQPNEVFEEPIAKSGPSTERNLTEQSILSDLPNGAPIIRVADGDMSSLPYRLTGRFDLGCTGTMIGPRQIITAAHCVYNYKSGKYHSPKSLRFRLGRHGKLSQGTLMDLDRIYAPNGYTQHHRATSDYAVVITKQSVAPGVGRMVFGVADEDVPFETTKIHINGYPAYHGFRMYHTHCIGKRYAERRVLYPCDTYGGMSGSSVYMLYPDGKRVVYGVHSGPWDSKNNRGVRLTVPIFLQVREWKRTHD